MTTKAGVPLCSPYAAPVPGASEERIMHRTAAFALTAANCVALYVMLRQVVS